MASSPTISRAASFGSIAATVTANTNANTSASQQRKASAMVQLAGNHIFVPPPPPSTHVARPSQPSAQPPKQLRFVASDGLPHPKRRRISAACRTCRKRKIRCSGERPICKTCSDNNHECLGYADPPPPHRTTSSENLDALSPPKAELDNADSQPAAARRPLSSLIRSRSLDEVVSGADSQNVTFDDALATSSQETTRPRHDSVSTKEPDAMSDFKSPASSNQSMAVRNRVPYFRYFGPTAIVPGFKQMVVQVREHRKSTNSAESPVSVFSGLQGPSSAPTFDTPSASGETTELPFYDASDTTPNHALITHLCEIFFLHLGCNFPFLQRESFMHDLENKDVEAVLVDVLCAMGARFSMHPLLIAAVVHRTSDPDPHRCSYGQPYAQRAMTAVVDSFSYPTLAMVQASLLLAYLEFGSNHDSGLWMYLGISIRMAQDLGMQKLEGLQFEYGRLGPTPKTVKSGHLGRVEEQRREDEFHASKRRIPANEDPAAIKEQRASERERIDSFWCIFFLDRVISSGTGRPVTLRDKDIEVSFPPQEEIDQPKSWPPPFPPLIRIIHLYGRVTDLLNTIKDIHNVTEGTMKKLAAMESDLTAIYQRLSSKLHFNAINFQHYVKAGEGTNFILLHFWFHTLIVLLHQPTLLHSFSGRVQQLFPNSRELSMSSAKTIADILSFAELLDAKSFIGNPFTSQPMYIAACAFLVESVIQSNSNPNSNPGSRAISPSRKGLGIDPRQNDKTTSTAAAAAAKHTLLASAATQNYQRCYKCLKSLESYWGGTKYILTVLDQKAKGIVDPLLYTTEEMDSAVEGPRSEPLFRTPGWRKTSISELSPTMMVRSPVPGLKAGGGPPRNEITSTSGVAPFLGNAGSPAFDPSQVLGFSLTGSTNSANPNFSFLYQAPNGPGHAAPELDVQAYLQGLYGGHTNQTFDATNFRRESYQMPQQQSQQTSMQTQSRSQVPLQQPFSSPIGDLTRFSPMPNAEPASTSDADLLLGLHSPYSTGSATSGGGSRFGPAQSAIRGSQSQNEQQQQRQQGYNYLSKPSGGSAALLQATSNTSNMTPQHSRQNTHHDFQNQQTTFSHMHQGQASTHLSPSLLNIESQDIDLISAAAAANIHHSSALNDHDTNTSHGNISTSGNDHSNATGMGALQLPFLHNGEFVPWLEYLPQDVLELFGGEGGGGGTGMGGLSGIVSGMDDGESQRRGQDGTDKSRVGGSTEDREGG